jgi:hypothetical protein
LDAGSTTPPKTEQDSIDKAERLRNKPNRPNLPTTTPKPSPKPSTNPPPNPNSCKLEDKNKTCANHEEYYKYSRLIEATDPSKPFNGFIYKSKDDTDLNDLGGLQEAIRDMKTFRQNRIEINDNRQLYAETFFNKRTKRDEVFQANVLETTPTFKGNDLFKDPYNQAKHINILIKGTRNQSGGSAGKYVFCQEGNPPKLVVRFGIFNIKDNSTPQIKYEKLR